MIIYQVVWIARVPNELDWVRVQTECVDPEDTTCQPLNTKLHIKVRKILSASFIMRKKLKKRQRDCLLLIFLLLTPFLLGGGIGWGGLFTPPLYLLNNSYCGIFLNVYKLCNFLQILNILDLKHGIQRGVARVNWIFLKVSQIKRIEYILERNLESRYDFFQPPLARKDVQSVQIM